MRYVQAASRNVSDSHLALHPIPTMRQFRYGTHSGCDRRSIDSSYFVEIYISAECNAVVSVITTIVIRRSSNADPANITRQHIIQAMKRIEVKGVPKVNKSRRYDLDFGNQKYPPKYTICLGNDLAGNRELPVADFYGGKETNKFLKRLNFTVCDKKGRPIK